MKRFAKVVVLLALAAVICLPGMVNAAYVETFTASNASWFYGYGTNFTSPQNNATWVSTGGNPTGHISDPVVDSGTSNGLYAVWTITTAPYGNMNGLSLTVDTKIGGTAAGNAQFYVGREGTYFIDGIWSIGNDQAWTTHSVALNTTNFTPWTGNNTNLYTLAQVLQAPDDIGIFFGGSVASGAGNLAVDNFGTVPIPAAVWLLGSGLVGLVGIRRRFWK